MVSEYGTFSFIYSAKPGMESAVLAPSRGHNLLSREACGVAGASLVFGAVFSYPIFFRLFQASEQNDWDFESQLNWVPYYTAVHFHQFPLWNPWKCGGMPMLGNPQSRFFTPFFLLHLLAGPMVGAHLEIIIHLAIAWAGGYVLARVLGLGTTAAITAATIFPACGWFPLQMGEGHLVHLPFTYLPLFLALMLMASKRSIVAPAIAGALLITFSFGEGGAEVLIYGAPLILVLAACEAIRCGSLRPIAFLAVAGIFAAGFSAIKLLPMIELLHEHGRVRWGPSWILWRDFPRVLFARNQVQMALSDRFYIESGDYISLTFVILAAAGLLLGRTRALPWIICGWVLFLFIRGDNCAIPLYTWMRELPFLSMLQLSTRFLIPFTLCVAVLAAIGVDEVARRFGRAGHLVAIALLAVGALDSLLVGTPFLRHAYDRLPHHFDYSPAFRQLADRDAFDMTVVSQANMGFVHCYEYTKWDTNVVAYNEKGYRGEQYMQGPGAVKLLVWTPNRLTYEIDAPSRSMLVINQNFEPGWHVANGGGQVISAAGLLAVAVGEGRRQLTLVYSGGWPFEAGLAISVLAFVAAAFICLTLILSRTSRTAKR